MTKPKRLLDPHIPHETVPMEIMRMFKIKKFKGYLTLRRVVVIGRANLSLWMIVVVKLQPFLEGNKATSLSLQGNAQSPIHQDTLRTESKRGVSYSDKISITSPSQIVFTPEPDGNGAFRGLRLSVRCVTAGAPRRFPFHSASSDSESSLVASSILASSDRVGAHDG